MSSLPADLMIWVLLFTGVIFCGIGLMGHGPDLPHAVPRFRAGCRELDDVRNYPGKDRMETAGTCRGDDSRKGIRYKRRGIIYRYIFFDIQVP